MTNAEPTALDQVVERLLDEHGAEVSPDIARDAVARAWEAVAYFGATDDADMVGLAHRIAERDLRLRLGLDREVARLDPEDHSNRGLASAD